MSKTKSKRPYWLWDYDLTEADVRRILRGKNEVERRWLMARILESAKYEDVWKYLKYSEVRADLPKLKLKPRIREAWESAYRVWEQL